MTRTIIDERKSAADFRIVAANGGSFTLRANFGAPALAGRGVKPYRTSGTYEVTRAALARIEKSHSVYPDF